jgi:hypothetical protein
VPKRNVKATAFFIAFVGFQYLKTIYLEYEELG